ncbi:MAG: NAD(P)-dependent oxidoreductase, partial [Pirellulales bacterium]
MATRRLDNLPRIAFFGTGAMGAPMAQRLAEAGYAISVWNRTRSRAEHLSAFGADVFDTPDETARDATIAITMLESGPVVDAVLFPYGASTIIEHGSTVIDMSSIPPSTASGHAVRLEDLGIGYLDAPVSGGTRGAA